MFNKFSRVLELYSRLLFPRETGRSSRCMHPSFMCRKWKPLKSKLPKLSESALYNTHRHTNNNNCILGVMRDRCTPGALKLLKDALGKHMYYYMNALLIRMLILPLTIFSFHCSSCVQFLFNSPGSWTAAVLSDRNSKLTCVLYVCTYMYALCKHIVHSCLLFASWFYAWTGG